MARKCKAQRTDGVFVTTPRRSCLLLAVLVMPACTTARVSQFRQFADAGQAYVEAVQALTREAGNAAVDADSAALERARRHLPQQERAEAVLEHDELVRTRVLILADLGRHARLLGAYFATLEALAESDAPREIGDATETLVESMGAVSARLRTARVGDAPIDSFSGAVVAISVANLKKGALERELRLRGQLIERELDLQQAAVTAITDQMKTDLQAVLMHREQIDVVEPYGGTARLARVWTTRRREILTATASVASAEAGVRAAEHLKLSFEALAENRFGAAQYLALLADIDEVLTLIEAVAGRPDERQEG